MGIHSEIHGALYARLAQLSPSCPVAWEGMPFERPPRDAADTPHVVTVTWPEAAPSEGDTYGLTVDGTAYSVTAQAGDTQAQVIARLAAIIFPSAKGAGLALTVTGKADASPLAVSAAEPTATVDEAQAPAYGSVWMRPTVMPAMSSQATLGNDGLNMQRGVFQVSVFAPSGYSWGRVKAVADAVAALFTRGTRLDADGFEVVIERVWPSTMADDGAWVHVPVSVSYRAHTPND